MATPRSLSGTAPKPSTCKVPFLPGMPTGELLLTKDHRLKQTLTYAPGGATVKLRNGDLAYSAGHSGLPKLDLSELEKMCDPMHRYNTTSARSYTHDEREAMKESARNTYRPAIPPAWLKHDRQVLRFAAYFQEPVHENPKENFRIRHCTLYFYLEDGTIMISEPKIENSGIPQGAFVKRHRIEKLTGGFFNHRDLNNADTINIYGRAFRIYDCDAFTREFYEGALGITLRDREEPPIDSFVAAQLAENETLRLPKNRDVIEGKEYNELAIGGNRKNAKLQQFLENDRKVLAFKAFWDDPTKYGSRMYYTLHYYLADDTVEILENLARNSGRDPYPVFWRRAPLLRNPHVSPAPAMLAPEPQPYTPEDMIVGGTVKVYGREIFLYDCDDFSRDFYRQYMNLEQSSMEIKNPDPVHVQLQHPPHTTFGAEEDSLASCLHLTPRPPRRDINKMMNEAGKVLRFEGVMATEKAEDANRRFVIAVHLADDGVAVWEKRQRNSGHAEGKFALKSRKKNPATGTWFKPEDFFVGARVEINGMPFELSAADEATERYFDEEYARQHPEIA